MTQQTRIAWFTQSDTTAMSGRFTLSVLPHIKSHCEVEVFTDSFEPFLDFPTHHYLSAFRRHESKPFDIHFYQVENGKSAHFLRSALGLHPGVTLFHDFLMTDFGPDPLTNSPWSAVVEKFQNPALSWPERFKEFPRKEAIAQREAGLTVVPMFSSIRAHGEFKRNIKQTLSSDRSMYVPLPVRDTGIIQCEHKPSVLHVGFCGSPRIEHRAHKLLHALYHARVPYKLFWLLDVDEEAQAKELLSEFRVGSAEIVSGRSPERWEKLLADIHIGVHTLFSVFGSTGYYFPQTLMAGKAAIITRFADSENIPPQIAFQIDPGETEAAQMAALFQELYKKPEFLINSAGHTYALENHEASHVAKDFLLGLKSVSTIITNADEKWSELTKSARNDLLTERYVGVDAWGRESIERRFNELGWS